MPEVRMPDGQIVRFPDDMPPEKIKQLIQSKYGGSQEGGESYSGTILPFTRDEDGLRFDSNAGIIGPLKRAFMLPGDVMKGKVDLNSPDAVGRVTEAATIMTPMSVASRAAVPAASKAIGPRASRALRVAKRKGDFKLPTTQQLDDAADAGYTALRESDVVFKSDAIALKARELRVKLNELGFDETLAPDTFKQLAKLENPPDGSFLTTKNIETARRTLNNVWKKNIGPNGNGTDSSAARSVINLLDDFVSSPPSGAVVSGDAVRAGKIAKDARGNFAAARRAEKIENVEQLAELQAASANSGQNTANRIRQKLAQIVDPTKPQRSAGYSDEEIKAIEAVVRGGVAENTLRSAGNLLGGGQGLGGGLAAGAAGAAGYAAGGPVAGVVAGAAPVLAGRGLKAGAAALGRRGVARVGDMIRSRSPLAQALEAQAGYYYPNIEKHAAVTRALMAGQLPQE